MNSSTLDYTSKSACDRSEDTSSNKKVSTSCDQKVESCNNDGVSSGNTSGIRNSISAIDIISDKIDMMSYNDDDDPLFQDPPPREDCPICMLPMPFSNGVCGVTMAYMSCCGKSICSGCMIAAKEKMRKGKMKWLCLFCRVPLPTTYTFKEEKLKRLKKRMKQSDTRAYVELGLAYRNCDLGLPRDLNKTIELWQKAAELGSISAHYNLGSLYCDGQGVEQDIEKGIQHFKIAAIGGDERGRHNLGSNEFERGNMYRAMKHFMIAAKSGEDNSLRKVGIGYRGGIVTKDGYATTLRAHQCSKDKMKSKQRDIAAAQKMSR